VQPNTVLGGYGSSRPHTRHPRAIARHRALHGSLSSSKNIERAACSTPAERPLSPRRPLYDVDAERGVVFIRQGKGK
jgi:hypothetical protein